MNQELAGKVAVVTGAAQGIGEACALALARAGATVVVADLDGAAAQVTAARIAGATAVTVTAARTDVADPTECRALITGPQQNATARWTFWSTAPPWW